MNIIKFKDTTIDVSSLTDETQILYTTLYNKYFRGKYCWTIQMTHCLPMKSIDVEDIPGVYADDYTLLERYGVEEMLTRENELHEPLPKTDDGDLICVPLTSFIKYISTQESPAYSNTDYFIEMNKRFDGNGGLSADLVRRYRAQVAACIYNGIQCTALDLCDKKQMMLEYYIYDMTDNVTSALNVFKMSKQDKYKVTNSNGCGCGSPTVTTGVSMNVLNSVVSSGCGCAGDTLTSLSSLITSASCDAVKEYRRMMKSYMIETFGDLDFWKYVTENYKLAITRIVKYTRAVIDMGLSIFNTSRKNLDLNYCCDRASGDMNTVYNNYLYDLKNIADVFELIESEDYTRLSFIKSNLKIFTDYYEYMQWDDSNMILFPDDDRWVTIK